MPDCSGQRGAVPVDDLLRIDRRFRLHEELDEVSVVTAPYEVDGQVVGTVGVIGPTRMAYERVIPIVDITARLLSSALSHPPYER